MGIFKEEVNFLEELARRQVRIWPDACDYGVPKADMSKGEVKRLRFVTQTLLNLPGSKVIWKVNLPAVQRQYRLIIMWGRNGKMYDATQCNLAYYKDRKREHFTFDIKHIFTDRNGNPSN